MSGSSLFLVLIALIAYTGDLLPGRAQLDQIRIQLGGVPANVRAEIHSGVASLSEDCKLIRREAAAMPARVRYLGHKLNANARVLCSDARTDAHQLAQHFATVRQSQ